MNQATLPKLFFSPVNVHTLFAVTSASVPCSRRAHPLVMMRKLRYYQEETSVNHPQTKFEVKTRPQPYASLGASDTADLLLGESLARSFRLSHKAVVGQSDPNPSDDRPQNVEPRAREVCRKAIRSFADGGGRALRVRRQRPRELVGSPGSRRGQVTRREEEENVTQCSNRGVLSLG